MLKAFGLPRGVALVRVVTPIGPVTALSDRLSKDERTVALAMAHQKIRDGAHAVILGELEVSAVLREVA